MSGFGRAAREQAEYERHHYPGTDVLRNRLGLRDGEALELSERYFAAIRARQGFPASAYILNVVGLIAIHHHLFQDVYDWPARSAATRPAGARPLSPPPKTSGPGWTDNSTRCRRPISSGR